MKQVLPSLLKILGWIIALFIVGSLILAIPGCGGSIKNVSPGFVVLMGFLCLLGLMMLIGGILLLNSARKDGRK